MGATLRKAGHHVYEQPAALAALGLMNGASFDIVLVGMKMPGMSGQEFYAELARKSPAMTSRVVFMTGDTVSRRTRDFLESTDRPVIEKPFDVGMLERVIAQELLAHTR